MRTGIHEREAGRDPRLLARPPVLCIRTRWLPDELTKSAAEGTEAAEADGEADLCNRERRVPQELLGTLDSAEEEVLMRRLAEGFLETADEVRPRRMRFAGNGGDVERFGEVAVDHIFGTAEMDVDRNRVAHSLERLEPE
jgi:hypothetical protein